MATSADEMEDGVEGEAPAKGGGKGLIIALVLLLVLGGGGFAAWKFLGAKDDAAKAKAWQEKNKVAASAYLRDSDGKVGKAYDAKTTPQIFVINAEGTLVYNGAIDSIRSSNPDDIAKADNYAKAALASVKAGKPVEKATSQPYGCSVKY